MISRLAPLFRSVAQKGEALCAPTLFRSNYPQVLLDKLGTQKQSLCKPLKFNKIYPLQKRDYLVTKPELAESNTNSKKDDLLVDTLHSTFEFSYDTSVSMRRNFENAPYRLQKDLNFIICMQNLSQLKTESGFDLEDIQKHPDLNEKIFETESIDLFKFPKAVLDILNGPTSQKKDQICHRMQELYDFELEPFVPFFLKDPVLLEKLVQEKILKPHQLSLNFFSSQENFLEFAKKYPKVAQKFFTKEPRTRQIFTSEEILSIAQFHENPYAFSSFFLFDQKSTNKLDEFAKNSPSQSIQDLYQKNMKAKNLGSLGKTVFKMALLANILLIGFSFKYDR
jgi:hypothetical protein